MWSAFSVGVREAGLLARQKSTMRRLLLWADERNKQMRVMAKINNCCARSVLAHSLAQADAKTALTAEFANCPRPRETWLHDMPSSSRQTMLAN